MTVSIEMSEDDIATLRMERNFGVNSLDGVAMQNLQDVTFKLLDKEAVKAVIITGSGKHFCAGADVKGFEEAIHDQTIVDEMTRLTGGLHPLLSRLRKTPKIIISALNGAAAGGGLGLALASDRRVATHKARLAFTHMRLGLAPDGGVTWLLPRMVGEHKARKLLFSNSILTAQEGLDTGLLDEVVDEEELIIRAHEMAREWAQWPEVVKEGTKVALHTSSFSDFETQLRLEADMLNKSVKSESFIFGVKEFLTKKEG